MLESSSLRPIAKDSFQKKNSHKNGNDKGLFKLCCATFVGIKPVQYSRISRGFKEKRLIKSVWGGGGFDIGSKK